MRLSIDNFNRIINVCFALFYISILFIIAGIDKENKDIQLGVVFCGYLTELIYIIYQCTLGNVNVYQYVIYLIILIAILILSNLSLRLGNKVKYYIKILYLILYMIVFSGSKIFILTAIFALLIISIYSISSKTKKQILPIGYCLSVSNILIILMSNILINYMT